MTKPGQPDSESIFNVQVEEEVAVSSYELREEVASKFGKEIFSVPKTMLNTAVPATGSPPLLGVTEGIV